MTRYGIEVSQDKDVDATSKDQLVYSSDYASPKIADPKTGSFNTNSGGAATTTIPHPPLTYAPAVFAYIKYPDGRWHSVNNNTTYCETDATFVTLVASGLTANTTYNYKFWIFSDPAQEITNV